jgi:hypothetical protein
MFDCVTLKFRCTHDNTRYSMHHVNEGYNRLRRTMEWNRAVQRIAFAPHTPDHLHYVPAGLVTLLDCLSTISTFCTLSCTPYAGRIQATIWKCFSCQILGLMLPTRMYSKERRETGAVLP